MYPWVLLWPGGSPGLASRCHGGPGSFPASCWGRHRLKQRAISVLPATTGLRLSRQGGCLRTRSDSSAKDRSPACRTSGVQFLIQVTNLYQPWPGPSMPRLAAVVLSYHPRLGLASFSVDLKRPLSIRNPRGRTVSFLSGHGASACCAGGTPLMVADILAKNCLASVLACSLKSADPQS
jgi:hypothetical protein